MDHVPTRDRRRRDWLARSDKRRAEIRDVIRRLNQIASDLGGRDNITAVTESIMIRFAHAEALAVRVERQIAKGEAFDLAEYLAIIERVVRIGTTLGLERRQRELPSLDEYLEQKADAQQQGAEPGNGDG
jgi:hypothetical protein